MMHYLLILLSVSQFAIALYILHKVRRVHLMNFEMAESIRNIKTRQFTDLHQQLQALLTLESELSISGGLPPTRGWAASPDFLLLIARHARDTKPQVVVECGSGASTVVLARCLQLNMAGHVYTLEHDPVFARYTQDELARHGLSEWATVIDAPLHSQEIAGGPWQWYDLAAIPDIVIDMLIVDGPPNPQGELNRYPAGPILISKLQKSGIVFVDDATRKGEKKMVSMWKDMFPSLKSSTHLCEKGCISLNF